MSSGKVQWFLKQQLQERYWGKEVTVSEVKILDVTQCWLEGAKHTEDWTKDIGRVDSVFEILLNDPNQGTKKFVASQMHDKTRVLHQLLNKEILHKAGSKDSFSSIHAFYLCHLMLCQ